MKKKMTKTDMYLIGNGIVMLILIVAIFTPFLSSIMKDKIHSKVSDGQNGKSIGEMRTAFIDGKENIIKQNIIKGDYACCLKKPCTYCIEKSPGHGEGAKCACLADIMNGVHPCGECIGEILEGDGNPLIAKYFAEAIAEKIGEKRAVMNIIEDKYGISISDQL